jgi:Curlin associated repeat
VQARLPQHLFNLITARPTRIKNPTKMNRLLTTTILVAMIGLGAMSRPASAGGVTVMLSPHGDSADIIQQGLQIYAMIKEQKDKKKKKNHAHVDQKGHDNAAALSQKGNDNYGVIVQRGHDHNATIAQNGDNNALGLFQFGRKTNLDVVQAGRGQVGLVLQGGW